MAKISVIVPVYQSEAYLRRCLDSILCQTYTNLEIILIDDGSRDTSGEICDEYANQDARVIVIHKENAGVAAARNTGLDLATGDYITFVDSDDYINNDMYQKMMAVATKYNVDLVMCDCVKENKTDRVLYTHNIRAGYYDYQQLKLEYYPHLLMMENIEYPATISNCLCLFRRKLSSNLTLPRYIEGVRYSEDLLFGAQLIYLSRSFYYMKGEPFYHYCMNSTSATHTYVADKWNDFCALFQEIYRYFFNIQEFNFRQQVYLSLLFFVYNSLSDTLLSELSHKEKKEKIQHILNNANVKSMFEHVNIFKLPITLKLKWLTILYKIGNAQIIIWYYQIKYQKSKQKGIKGQS